SWVCRWNKLDIVKLLLVHGANVDQRSLDVAQNRPEILRLLTLVKEYDAAKNKTEFIKSTKNNENYNLLVKRVLIQSLNEARKKDCLIDGTIFGQLYRQLKNDNKFRIVLDLPENCENIYEFIRYAAKKNYNNHIYLKEGFIEKNIMSLKSKMEKNIMSLKIKADLKKQKFTDTTIEFAEDDEENMEDEKSNQIIQNLIKGFADLLKKRKREENKEKESREEEDDNVNKKRKL
ncbi:MAG: hypothetical protein ACD_79C00428G0001, partial [uncultured bacterium]